MAIETEEFRASDLIGSAGVGSNGEKLISTLDYHYPPELQAALLRRPNEELRGKLSDTIVANVAKIAGADRIAHLEVRGGDVDPDDAYITYAFYDRLRTVVKGAIPWADRGKSSSDGHVSQRDSVLNSPAARDHLAAKAKADAAASSEDVDALRAEVEALSERLSEKREQEPEPFLGYSDARAADLATELSHLSRELAVTVLDYERAHEDRSTVTNAAQKRIDTLDAEDAAARAEQERVATENEQLRARVAELEEQVTAPTEPPAS